MASNPPVIRVPNLPNGPIVDENKMPTDDELTFRHALITNLQQLFGNEGTVIPTQNATNIPTIQNNQLPNGQYTCGFGRFIYDSTNNRILVSIDNGAGVPVFMQVDLSIPVPPV